MFNYKMKVVLADGSIGEVEPSKTELEFPTARTVLHTEVNKVILIGEMHNHNHNHSKLIIVMGQFRKTTCSLH